MKRIALAVACATVLAGGVAHASSHREAPLITKTPKLDATDFYLFRSYETGRSNYVTMIANYDPLQAAYGGPNYFTLDAAGLYDINIDNNGDAVPDLIFRFHFRNGYRNISIPVNGVDVAVPLANVGPFSSSADPALNLVESYTVDIIRQNQPVAHAINPLTGGTVFIKPHDNIGTKSIADYRKYADKYINRMSIPGCGAEAKVFVGQRQESFSVNVGEIFDLIHTNPVGPADGEQSTISDDNITSLALEVPVGCLATGGSPIIGGWTTASLVENGVRVQKSRLSAPLINEVIIGLPDKDAFNASRPYDDAQFAKYVTNPTLPEIIQALFGVTAPNAFPRTDLVAAFLTGLDGLNKPASVRPAEMMRLNTATAPVAAAGQNTLGVIAGDNAGFPNGRRPGDDVVDIELRVAMGLLLDDAAAPSRLLPYTDGAAVSATQFRSTFPYLNTPIPGATD